MSSNGSSEYAEVANTAGATPPDVIEILRVPGAGDLPLLPESQYEFKAIAVNNVDICLVMPSSLAPAGAVSAWTRAAAVPGAPPAPYLLSATGGQLSIELVPPPNMRGSVLSGFSVTTSESTSDFVAADGAIVHSISFLMADSSYIVQVAAVTNLGTTAWSTPITMNTTAPTVPTSPRHVTVTNITASSAIVQWSMPLDSGGTDLSGRIGVFCEKCCVPGVAIGHLIGN